jgi:hypothetical protein
VKIVLIIIGTLAGLYSIAQLLQFLGVFGAGSGIAGIALTLLSGAASYACFKKAIASR